jgi:Holliday junction resolvase
MSKYARTKGHSFERQIAKELRELGFKNAQTMRASRGGDWSHTDDGRDIVGTPHLAIQCKRMKDYCPVSTIEEIVKYPKEEEIRIVVTKANNKETMCILSWEDFKELIFIKGSWLVPLSDNEG